MKIYSKHIVFKEVVDSLYNVFKNMQYRVIITDKVKQDDEDLYIIVGGAEFCDIIPKKYIVYQFEQTNVSYNNVKDIWFTKKYVNFLKNALDVWDYSMSNVEYLKKNYNITSIRYVPLRYSSSIDRAPRIPNKDIDVLFMGSLSNRRKKILDSLRGKVNLYIAKNNLWREERDKLVSRSKLIINIQFYDKGILELPRISYLLSNRALVISEKGREKNLSKEMDKYMVTCTYKLLETKILEYLKKPNQNQIRKKFYAKWKETDYSQNFDFIKLYQNEFIKTKSKSKKRKKGKINYYIPKNIESIEFKVSPEGFCSLSLPPIPDSELPSVSIITPTKNRGFIFKLAIYNFYNFIYPTNKLEWVILDNGNERIESLLPNDKRIKYIKLDPNEEYAIGFLRNKCIENSSHEHICYMDDDDCYCPESILARIKSLIKYSSEGVKCVGCAQVGCYNVKNKQSVIGTNNPMFLSEASLAHTKEFWRERNYDNNDYISEYKHFLLFRQSQLRTIPYQFVLIALNHNKNITGKSRYVNNYNKWIKENSTNQSFSFFDLFEEPVKKIIMELSANC